MCRYEVAAIANFGAKLHKNLFSYVTLRHEVNDTNLAKKINDAKNNRCVSIHSIGYGGMGK